MINNSDLDIKDNIFKINDSNYGCVNSINLYNENYGNKISYNKFISIDGISIKLENNNSGNLIMYNNINGNNFAIILNDGNNSNIIKENSLSTISSSSILLLINNLSNLIYYFGGSFFCPSCSLFFPSRHSFHPLHGPTCLLKQGPGFLVLGI